jgi:hypothetical protein
MAKQYKKLFVEGQAEIRKAGLSSQRQIDAYNLWKAVVLLQDKLGQSSMRIYEVGVDDVIKWV